MIDELKPYPEYKDSGLPWLGMVPGHWPTRRTKSIISNVLEQTTTMSRDDVYLALEHVESWTGRTRPVVGGSLFTGQVKRFRVGDVLFGKLRPYLAKVAFATTNGVCAGEFFVLRPRDSNIISRYLELLLRSKPAIDVINGSTFGAKMPRADWQFLGNLSIPIPPPDEQAAIVRFLDHANGKIERAIRAKKKLIALLNEQKQAIIHRAVTRGLDANVKLKPSGIPWLGDVPEHWEVRPLKQLLMRMDYGTSENARGEGKIRVIGMGDIRDGKVRIPERGGLKAMPPDLHLEKNDLLFNRTNSPDLVGKVGLFEGEASDEITFASYLVRLRVRNYIGPAWLNYLLNSSQFWSFARSQALISLHQANLNSKRYGRMLLPVPPGNEQIKITDFIKAHVVGIERAIFRTNCVIALLREYRTTLTADIVTGKLDVREAVKRLPAEAEEALPADDLPDDLEDEDANTHARC